MSEWADSDYEATPDEIRDSFSYFADLQPGAHGTIDLVAALADHIWRVENVWWSGRRVREDGIVQIDWLVTPPPECFTHD